MQAGKSNNFHSVFPVNPLFMIAHIAQIISEKTVHFTALHNALAKKLDSTHLKMNYKGYIGSKGNEIKHSLMFFDLQLTSFNNYKYKAPKLRLQDYYSTFLSS